MSCERFRPAIAAHAGGAAIDAAGRSIWARAPHAGGCWKHNGRCSRSWTRARTEPVAHRVARFRRESVRAPRARPGAVPAQEWIPAPMWAGLALAAAIALAPAAETDFADRASVERQNRAAGALRRTRRPEKPARGPSAGRQGALLSARSLLWAPGQLWAPGDPGGCGPGQLWGARSLRPGRARDR